MKVIFFVVDKQKDGLIKIESDINQWFQSGEYEVIEIVHTESDSYLTVAIYYRKAE